MYKPDDAFKFGAVVTFQASFVEAPLMCGGLYTEKCPRRRVVGFVLMSRSRGIYLQEEKAGVFLNLSSRLVNWTEPNCDRCVFICVSLKDKMSPDYGFTLH